MEEFSPTKDAWETVDESRPSDSEDLTTERLRVAGGWLYKVEETSYAGLLQSHMVFVPLPKDWM